jgi:flavodoxin
VKVSIVYSTKTGRTKKASQQIHELLSQKGHTCELQNIKSADPESVLASDIIIIGCWTAGLIYILQHPQKEYFCFLKKISDLSQKKIILFCTYKIAIGKMLDKMARPILDKNASLLGSFRFKGDQVDEAFLTLADTIN